MFKKTVLGMTTAGVLAVSMATIAGGIDQTAEQQNAAGFYALGQAGYAWSNADDIFTANTQGVTIPKGALTKKPNGFTGRVAAGYKFNPYVALEAGAAYLPQVKYTAVII